MLTLDFNIDELEFGKELEELLGIENEQVPNESSRVPGSSVLFSAIRRINNLFDDDDYDHDDVSCNDVGGVSRAFFLPTEHPVYYFAGSS